MRPSPSSAQLQQPAQRLRSRATRGRAPVHASRRSSPSGGRRAALLAALAGPFACGPAAVPAAPTPSCVADRAVVLASQADVARLAGCTIARAITIRSGGALDTSGLRGLTTITGDLVIGPTVAVGEITFPALRTLGGALRVRDNGLVQGVFFPVLARAGEIEIDNNAALTTVSLPALGEIAGGLAITDDASLELVDLPRLTSIGGALVIANQPNLTLVESGSLRRAASVRLDRAPKLPAEIAAQLRGSADSR